jgi:beta-phosphoglucomutase-like phosphatase (HAD superfamily)
VLVDGDALRARQQAAGPVADVLLTACELLAVEPGQTAVFETSPAGIAAARAAGFHLVVEVDPTGHAAPRKHGADLVVGSLGDLLERGLPSVRSSEYSAPERHAPGAVPSMP